MKKIICTLLIIQAAILGAGEVDKTKEIITTLLSVDQFRTVIAEKMIPSMGSTKTVDEVANKYEKECAQESIQGSLRQKFLKRFSPDQIDEIYAFVTSDLYKKCVPRLACYSQEIAPEMATLIMNSVLDPAKIEGEDPSVQKEEIPHKIIEANESNLESILNENKHVVLDVYAPWCGPCKKLAPILSELSNEFHGKYVFVKIDGDANRSLMSKLNVKGYPSLLFYKNGKEESRKVGFINKENIIEFMNTYFNT